MTAASTYGVFAEPAGESPLSQLTVSFTPLDFVTEWNRCSETADYLARYFAYDYGDHETAWNVLSTVINEVVENTVKFSSDKVVVSRLTVSEFADWVTISATSRATSDDVRAFGDMVARLVEGDPEAMFAERVAHPPETGSAGIGLIMLRKDYDARIGIRVEPAKGGASDIVVEITIGNREVEQA